MRWLCENIVHANYCRRTLKDIWDHWPHQCFVRLECGFKSWVLLPAAPSQAFVLLVCTFTTSRLSLKTDHVCLCYQLHGQIEVKVLFICLWRDFFLSEQRQYNSAAYNAWIKNTRPTAAQSHWIMMKTSLSHLSPLEVVYNGCVLLETICVSNLSL